MICYNVRMKMRMADVVGRMGRGLGGGFAGVRGHSLRRGLRRALLLAVTGLSGVAGAVTAFDAAESVWPAGLAEEMNTLIAFRAPFELKAGERPVLKMVAWYSYRVTLNGAFVGFGPARGPKGFFRPDEWDLAAAARPGRNELCVEVAGYNVPNFYLMEQPPFFKAEVVCADRVLAATKRVGGAFAATRQPRVQKVPRYSFQRTFVEAYRLPAAAHPPALALAAAPEPALIERRVPYPDFEVNPRMTPVSFAKVRYDETAPVRQDRSLSLPGQTGGGFKGFPLADLELNASFLAQRLDRREGGRDVPPRGGRVGRLRQRAQRLRLPRSARRGGSARSARPAVRRGAVRGRRGARHQALQGLLQRDSLGLRGTGRL